MCNSSSEDEDENSFGIVIFENCLKIELKIDLKIEFLGVFNNTG